MFVKRLAAAPVLVVCIADIALGQDIPLLLRLAGETAGPDVQFDVLVGDTVIGTTTITDAAPISSGKAAAAHLSDFFYDIPLEPLGSGQSIRVVLKQAPGDPGDTDIFLAEAILDGESIDAGDMLLTDEAGAAIANPFTGGMVAVWGKGWTVSIPVPETVAVAVAPVEATDGMADVGQAPAENGARCSVTTTVNLTDFQHGRVDLGEQDKVRLSDLARALEGQTCVVTVTGYASTRGHADVNAEISRLRAATAYEAMGTLNIDLSRGSRNGAGETVQFGSDPADNRRVVVEVMP